MFWTKIKVDNNNSLITYSAGSNCQMMVDFSNVPNRYINGMELFLKEE